MANGVALPRVITNQLLHCGQKRSPILLGEVLGVDSTEPAVARVRTNAPWLFTQMAHTTSGYPSRSVYGRYMRCPQVGRII